jgi:hypothetical protein
MKQSYANVLHSTILYYNLTARTAGLLQTIQ